MITLKHFVHGALAVVVTCAPSLARAAQSRVAPQPPPTSSIVENTSAGDLSWRLIGPHRAGWSTMVEGVPNNPDTFYFGAAGGGVWKSDNAGRTWTSIFDKGPASIGAIAVAPSDPRTIYVGTGQPEPRYDVQAGEGVFKSTDSGQTWTRVGLEATRHIGKIWVDPGNPDTVLVGAVGHFYGPNAQRGVFRSADGGRTWAQTLNLGDDAGVVDLASDPADPKVIIAVGWQARVWPWLSYFTPIEGPKSGLYKSSDGGVTWVRLKGEGWPGGPLGRTGIAVTRKNGALRIYAAVEAPKAGGLYRSDDGGGHWSRVNDEKAFTGWYSARITVDPHDPDVIYTVGQSIRRCDQGGARCDIIKGAPGGDDYHYVWINALHPERMAAASDQGTVVSVDGGATWSDWYNQPTGQFYHLAADNRFPFWIYSGQQDSGTVAIPSRSDFGAVTFRDWHPVGGDERDYDIPDSEDPLIVYSSGLGGRVSRFDTRTGQSADISPWPVDNYGQRPTLTRHHFVWVTPMVASQTGPTTLYLGGEVIFRSRDRGDHWDVISPDLTGKSSVAQGCDGDVAIVDARACGYGAIFSIQPSPRHADELWVGTDDGLIQLTRDAGATWKDVTPPSLPLWAKVSSIDVSRLQDGVAYAAIDNHRQDDFEPLILITRDYGATWRRAAHGLPAHHFVSVVRADPVKAGLLYAGTDQGVYVSVDDGSHWRSLQRNLPDAWVRDLLVHGDDLVAATQGRALWVLDNVTPLRQADSDLAREPLHLFTPAEAIRVRVDNNHDTPLPPETPQGRNPPEGAVIDYWLGAPAKGPVVLEVRDGAGQLVQRMTSDASAPPPAHRYFAAAWTRPVQGLPTAAGMHRVVWNLRWQRPKVVAGSYSIAAIFGEDTPITPQGAFAVPGDYQLLLKVDGREQHVTLRVAPDPRVRVSAADFAASLSFSQQITAELAKSYRGLAEINAVHEQLSRLSKAMATDASHADLASAVADLKSRTDPDAKVFGQPFIKADAALASLETDIERSDRAPTAAQLQVMADTASSLDVTWDSWATLRDGDLGALNARLKQAGRQPITFTPGGDVPPLGGGGEDLP